MKLVIAEKPSVGNSIASVIGANESKDGYRQGNGYIVSWCVGHLVGLKNANEYREEWKQWNYESLPLIPDTFEHKVLEGTIKQYKVVKNLMLNDEITEVICATDAGREGELIFRRVYYKCGCKKPIKRLWISSMEESAIKDGFAHLRDGAEFDNMFQAAHCRAMADWLVGINSTRLYTVLYRAKPTLSVGRVQSATLAMIVEREDKIKNFIKEKYYKAHIISGGINASTERIDNIDVANKILSDCMGKDATVISVTKENKAVSTPKLYDLTTLQRDANRILGFTAAQTSDYMQSLYEKKLVTYPRTDSQYLSEDMEETAKNVVKAVFASMPFVPKVIFNPDVKKIMNSKKITDHHAIIPTMEITKADFSSLKGEELKVLYLISNRLLCATALNNNYLQVKSELCCNGHNFYVSGSRVTDKGWKLYDEALKRFLKAADENTDDEQELPELSEGMILHNVDAKLSEHYTSPPKHFTEDTLLAAMENAGASEMNDEVERKGIGTTATRADIIEKIIKNEFIVRDKKNILPTQRGCELVSILPEKIKSPILTAEWENRLTLIAKGEESPETFIKDISTMVRELVASNSQCIPDKADIFAAAQEALGKCPKCGGDVVKGKFGAYCKNKCGMIVGRAMGATLSDSQVKSMLDGKRTLVKGLKGKNGSYDAYLIPEGVEDFSYIKAGEEVRGVQYKVKLEFPKKKK